MKTHAAHIKQPWDLATKFTSWQKLLKLTALVYQLIDRTCYGQGVQRYTIELTVGELA